MFDLLFFAVLPYLAVVIAVGGAFLRYFNNRYSYSSLSSEFLENTKLFWGSVPWHYGVILLLLGHLIGLVLPSEVIAWNGQPLRLYILEGTALSLGLLALFGLMVLILRRAIKPNIRVVTSPMDMILLVLLLVQLSTGIGIGLTYRWGTAWYVQIVSPYILSLVKFNPNTQLIASMPLLIRLHALNAFLLIGIIPFTRLVHLFSIPLGYIWRPYQRVEWYDNKKRAK